MEWHALRKLLKALALVIVLALALAGAARAGDGPDLGDLKKRIQDALARRDTQGAVRAIDEVAAVGSKKAAEVLMDLTAKIEGEEPYRALLRGLAAIQDEAAAEAIAKRLGSGATPVPQRVAIAEACGGRSDEATFQALTKALEDRNDPVQRAAILSLERRAAPRAIQALLDLLEREHKEGTTLPASLARRAIATLEKVEAGGAGGGGEGGDGGGGGGAAAGGGAERGGETMVRPRFFGTEVRSNKLVFVIDVSGSMRAEDPEPEGGPEETPGGGAGGEPGEAGGGPATTSRIRIDRAKAELIRAIEMLPEDADFTVLAYSGVEAGTVAAGGWLTVFAKSLQPATKGNVKKARKFVEQLVADGATYTSSALEEAFKVEGADLIILLSDGAPTEPKRDASGNAGPLLTPDEILANVSKWNRYRKIAIDTFGFVGPGQMPGPFGRGGGGNSEEMVRFLKELAAQSGGEYHSIY